MAEILCELLSWKRRELMVAMAVFVALSSWGLFSWSSSGAKEAAVSEVSAEPEVITRVVGEAGSRVVTSREVALNEAVGQVLSGLPLARDKTVLKLSDPSFPGQVVRVLDEWTVFFEALEIEARNVEKAEITRWVKSVQDQWVGSASWDRLEPSALEIRETVERKLVAQAFEKLKVDASLVSVSDQEALEYYKKNRLRFGSLPFENFKDNIKAALSKNQMERRLLDWRTVLRRKYKVRNHLGG